MELLMLWVTCCTCVFNQNQVSRNLFIHPSIKPFWPVLWSLAVLFVWHKFGKVEGCLDLGGWAGAGKLAVWLDLGKSTEGISLGGLPGCQANATHSSHNRSRRDHGKPGVRRPRDRDGLIAILLGHRKCLFVFLWSSKMVGIQIPF